jgi:hypothetical protein
MTVKALAGLFRNFVAEEPPLQPRFVMFSSADYPGNRSVADNPPRATLHKIWRSRETVAIALLVRTGLVNLERSPKVVGGTNS